jgi:hypothetical protein
MYVLNEPEGVVMLITKLVLQLGKYTFCKPFIKSVMAIAV